MSKNAFMFLLSILALFIVCGVPVSAQLKPSHPKVFDTTDPKYRSTVARSNEEGNNLLKDLAVTDSIEAIKREIEATPAHRDTYGPLHDPLPAVQFDEYLVCHNMSIASDGKYYYTING